jgi:hypothetical protein
VQFPILLGVRRGGSAVLAAARLLYRLLGPVICAGSAAQASAAEWFVASGGTGPGTAAAPLGRIQAAIDMAQPGDTVTVRPGSYAEALRTIRHGARGRPIRLRAAAPRGSVVVSTPGRVLRVPHADVVVEGLVLDGQYASADTVVVSDAAHRFVLRDTEVRRSGRDLIDLGAPAGVLIDGCLIHHALDATDGRTDAHGIVAGAVTALTIRDTEIHTFSGDGFQIDPGRASPGWKLVTVERTKIWLQPLAGDENGFRAGTTPGENAIDTKASASAPRSRLVLRDVVSWGFRNGLVSNMAAFNLKENVDVDVDGVTVFDSEIAFRVRGPGTAGRGGATVTVANALVYDVGTAFRYEDRLQSLRVWNVTSGAGVREVFRGVLAAASAIEARNLLVLGTLPAEVSHPSNLGVSENAFVSARIHDYRLAEGSPAIDAGVALESVRTDRTGIVRPQGAGVDVGAFERAGQPKAGTP